MRRRGEGTLSLFEADAPAPEGTVTVLGAEAFVLRGFARASSSTLLLAVHEIAAAAPFRHMQTPGGFTMSVALTNCGRLGWTSDAHGYRYTERDPETDRAWPSMPSCFLDLAQRAAAAAGFPGFSPDACLVNRYEPGARLTLHQDRNERSFDAPIVSVSLGLPATFLFGGLARRDRAVPVVLQHGDVAVWGGADRLRFHGVRPLADGHHTEVGRLRYNFTFRRAG